MVAEAVLKLLSSQQSLRERGEVDFILCVGDDRSDEDMFQTVKRFRDHARESPTPVLSPNSEDEVGVAVVLIMFDYAYGGGDVGDVDGDGDGDVGISDFFFCIAGLSYRLFQARLFHSMYFY